MILLGYQNECILAKDDIVGFLEQQKVIELDIKRASLLIAQYESGQRSSKQVLSLWRKQEDLRTIGPKFAVLVSLFAFKPNGGKREAEDARGGSDSFGTGGHSQQSRHAERIRCTIMVRLID